MVLDIGANIGLYARQLRQSGFDGHIFSFEPIPDDHQTIVRSSADDPFWHPSSYALGSEDTSKTFNVIKSSDGSQKGDGQSTILSSFLAPTLGIPVHESIPVTVRRLDSVLPELLTANEIATPRIFMKVDTQGFDIEVLKGAEGTLSKVLGVQVEMAVVPLYEHAPRYGEILEYLESKQYSLMDLLVVNRTPAGAVETYDCLMARTEELSS